MSLTKKNHLTCISRLKIHHQLENQCKELFSTELHWEIFCCITSYDYNFQREAWSCDIAQIKDSGERCKYLSLHHWFRVSFHHFSLLNWSCFLTEPKLNASFQRRHLRKSREWARCESDDLLSISEWPLQMSLTLFSLTRSLLTPICFSWLLQSRTTTSKQSLSR